MKQFLMTGVLSISICLSNARALAQDPYDESAARICSVQVFDSDKESCLQQIQGKHFNHIIISICAKQTFNSASDPV